MKSKFFAFLPLLCAGVLIFASCDGGPQPSSEPEQLMHTVCFKDGETTLHEVEVQNGSKVDAWDPSSVVTDKTFLGWYGEPTLTHEFDFNTVITADTSIFGSFVRYQKDTRHWGIAGSGTSSLLKTSNWGKVFTDDHYMTDVSTATENIFEMTVNLFSGDQFQFTDPQIDGDSISWGHQRGGAYLVDPGETFSVGGGLGADNYTSNITANQDGKYKFTLKTYPAGDFYKDNTTNLYDNRNYYDTLEWERLGDSDEEKAAVETTLFIKGADITGWGNYINDSTTMKEVSEGVVSLSNIYLKASDEFMFASQNKDVATGEVSEGNLYLRGTNLDEASRELVEGEGNMKVKADGYYTFTYTFETEVLNVVKVEDYTPKAGDYYFDGSFEGCGWKGAGSDEWKLVQDTENPDIYTLANPVTLAVDDEIGVQFYDKATSSYNGFYSAKNMVANANFDLTIKNNAVCLVAGTYTVSFNAYRHLLTLTPVI